MVDMVEYFGWKRAAIVYDFLDETGLYVKVCLAICFPFSYATWPELSFVVSAWYISC